jgi:hypothetical protein
LIERGVIVNKAQRKEQKEMQRLDGVVKVGQIKEVCDDLKTAYEQLSLALVQKQQARKAQLLVALNFVAGDPQQEIAKKAMEAADKKVRDLEAWLSLRKAEGRSLDSKWFDWC